MNSGTIIWGAIALYALGTGFLTWRSRKKTSSVEGFAVGSGKVSPILVGLSLAAQLTSVATFVVNPGLVYAYGLPGLLGLGVAAGGGVILGLVVLSRRFRRVGKDLGALTLPGWLGQRYGSQKLRLGFGLLSLALIAFGVLIVVGLGHVLVKLLGVPMWLAIALTLALVVPQVFAGGMNAALWTNAAQAIVMAIVALTLIGSGLFTVGDKGLFSALAAQGPELVALVNPKSLYFRTLFEVFVCNFIVGVALVCQPHVLTKALSVGSDTELRRYLTTAVVLGLIFTGVLVTGLYARVLMGPGMAIDLVIPTYIARTFSPALQALIALGLLCAGLSTLEGLLVAVSGVVAIDIVGPLTARRPAALAPLKVVRTAVLVLVVPLVGLALWQAANPSGGSVAIFAQYGVYGLFSAGFVPMLFGLRRGDPGPGWAAGLSAIVALVVYVGASVLEVGAQHNNPAVLSTYAILSALLVMGGATMLQRSKRSETAPRAHDGSLGPLKVLGS